MMSEGLFSRHNGMHRSKSFNRVVDGLVVTANAPKTDHFTHTFATDARPLKSDKPIIVLKIGSSSITSSTGTLQLSLLATFTETVCNLKKKGYHVIIVSSGAVSVGCNALKLSERPKDSVVKQVCSAVGQSRLARLYDDLFSTLDVPTALVLLSRENLSQEHHYLNTVNTLHRLLSMGVVPIINENDAVAVQELKFGDNDSLSALLAGAVRARWLFLLTDVDALYTANPHSCPDAQPVRVVPDVDALAVDTSDGPKVPTTHDQRRDNNSNSHDAPPPAASGQWGTGGMATKLRAASLASACGCRVSIISSMRLGDMSTLLDGNLTVGTTFLERKRVLSGRKKWIAQGLVPVGDIYIPDSRATQSDVSAPLELRDVMKVSGEFPSLSSVRVLNEEGKEVGRGIVNFGSEALVRMLHGRVRGSKQADLMEFERDHVPVVVDISATAVIQADDLALFPVEGATEEDYGDYALRARDVDSDSDGKEDTDLTVDL